MDFGRPSWLWLLLTLPALIVWVARGRRRLGRDWDALGCTERRPGDGAWAWTGAIVLLVVALAGPRWGPGPGGRRPAGQDVVLAVDVSRSMGARDAVPNRLGLAIEAARQVVEAAGRSPGGRVAVVAFAGRGVLRCPLTENLGAALDAITALKPGGVSPGGTDLTAALATALDLFDRSPEEPQGGRSIVLISDGEDLAETWQAALPQLAEMGVLVHTIAIGDAGRGHPVPLPGGAGELSYRGQPVRSRRVDATLETLARGTGGVFIRLGLAHPEGLSDLFVSRIEPAARLHRDLARRGDRADRYTLFVLGALGLGLAGSWPVRWRTVVSALAPWLLLGAGPTAPETVAEAVRMGNAAYRLGDARGALAAFERATRLDPGSPIPHYDAAAVLFQLGRYPEAARHYAAAYRNADAGLRTKIDYALGNTAYALGDVAAALRYYDACLASNAAGAAYDAVRDDAAVNREFVRRRHSREAPGEGPDRADNPPAADPAPPQPTPERADPQTPDRPDQPPESQAAPAPTPPDASTKARRSARTPERQLEDALRAAREARRRRLSDQPTPEADPDRKDW
jgi:Ca-activated chloride channel family protein